MLIFLEIQTLTHCISHLKIKEEGNSLLLDKSMLGSLGTS